MIIDPIITWIVTIWNIENDNKAIGKYPVITYYWQYCSENQLPAGIIYTKILIDIPS